MGNNYRIYYMVNRSRRPPHRLLDCYYGVSVAGPLSGKRTHCGVSMGNEITRLAGYV